MRKSNKKGSVNRLERIMDTPIADLPFFQNIGDYLRVCVYVRLSSESEFASCTAKEIRDYYRHLFHEHSEWHLIDLFIDKPKGKVGFAKMIEKAKQGEYDLIITPSFDGFCNYFVNTMDTVRELKELNPPIGIYFESEVIYSLKEESEMAMSFLSTVLLYEHDRQNALMKWSKAVKEQQTNS